MSAITTIADLRMIISTPFATIGLGEYINDFGLDPALGSLAPPWTFDFASMVQPSLAIR